ncbi:MAG TPA: hypothetical protein PKX94_05185 [Opitutales bacterium]|nr:hypothetical protein [Opitutales bacterium]HOO92839.1 hypothetical protein [Opitutales bacterium]
MSRRYENRHLGQSHNSCLPRVAVGSLLAAFNPKWCAFEPAYASNPRTR